jgi:hypothetical protein
MIPSPQISRVNTERRARCGLDSCTSDTSASDVQPFSKVLVKQFLFETFFQKTAAGCSGVAGFDPDDAFAKDALSPLKGSVHVRGLIAFSLPTSAQFLLAGRDRPLPAKLSWSAPHSPPY